MPLYDYRCTACGREVEVMHAIGGAGPTSCEACGGAMRKALSTPAIHFKGSGWAKKDAAATARKAKPGADSSTKTAGSEGTTKKAGDAGGESGGKATDSKATVSAGDPSG